MKMTVLALLVLVTLLTACAGQGGEVGKRLIIEAPKQARVSETVVIKVTDEGGKPISGAHFYHGYVGGTGITDRNGEVTTFFSQPGNYDYSVTKPGFIEGKGTIRIIPGPVELIAFGGVHIGPPPLPGQPPQTNNYRPGMTVKFRVTNIGTREFTLPDSAPWEIRTSEGKTVFSPVALQVIVTVKPGESKEWSWDQKDNNANQVKTGIYMVVMRCSEGEYRCLFSIVPASLQ